MPPPHDSPTADQSGSSALTLNHAYQTILRYLDDHDCVVDNSALITIAVRERELAHRECHVSELPFLAVQDRVTNHLRALAREGLICYDQADETVACAVPSEAITARITHDATE